MGCLIWAGPTLHCLDSTATNHFLIKKKKLLLITKSSRLLYLFFYIKRLKRSGLMVSLIDQNKFKLNFDGSKGVKVL